MDEPALRATLPRERVVEVGGARIGMVHIPGPARGRAGAARARFPGCDAVVYGHTHVPEVTRDDGVWILNPGLADRAAARAGTRDARARGRGGGDPAERSSTCLDTNICSLYRANTCSARCSCWRSPRSCIWGVVARASSGAGHEARVRREAARHALVDRGSNLRRRSSRRHLEARTGESPCGGADPRAGRAAARAGLDGTGGAVRHRRPLWSIATTGADVHADDPRLCGAERLLEDMHELVAARDRIVRDRDHEERGQVEPLECLVAEAAAAERIVLVGEDDDRLVWASPLWRRSAYAAPALRRERRAGVQAGTCAARSTRLRPRRLRRRSRSRPGRGRRRALSRGAYAPERSFGGTRSDSRRRSSHGSRSTRTFFTPSARIPRTAAQSPTMPASGARSPPDLGRVGVDVHELRVAGD